MRSRLRVVLPVVATTLSAAAAAASAQGLVGSVARPVDVIGLFFGGVGTGGSLTALAFSLRTRRRDARET